MKFVGVLLGVFIGFGILVLDRAQQMKEGLNGGNFEYNNWTNELDFIFANSSDNFGDVVIWVTQDDITKCEYVVNVRANSRYQLTLSCHISEGEYKVLYGWADYHKDRAAVAKRININY